jgi:glucosamine-6-phosphate deaminase
MEQRNIPGCFTAVESAFYRQAGSYDITTRIPYILVDNFPKLGLLTAFRFLEWIAANPQGVVSLPTGKTPEYFIKWTHHLLRTWDGQETTALRRKYSLGKVKRPRLDRLRFVQVDEFYPIDPAQHNSFFYYDNEFYIKGFGLNPGRALLINSNEIPLAAGKNFREIFPQCTIDSSLRYRECRTDLDKLQQESVFMIDEWCSAYEKKIRDMGGIGFFLGGIGPDGHIAFNIRGSDHYSTTRLTTTNFETQAVAATDLGGMEISRNRQVITIGLGTVTSNPDAVAIIIAAGEAKAGTVRNALENEPSNLYPATALQKLHNSRFFLTAGAASSLHDSMARYFRKDGWDQRKSERIVIELCRKLGKYGHHLTQEEIDNDEFACLPGARVGEIVPSVEASVKARMKRSMEPELNQRFLHTGPHHDDIMLGILPHIAHQLRSHTNTSHFAVMTSGFTAVTNRFLRQVLQSTLKFISEGKIQMLAFPDFFEQGHALKWDKDVYHFLDNVASRNAEERLRGLSHRVVRAFVAIFSLKSTDELTTRIGEMIAEIDRSYDGEKNPPEIQTLKGMIREFEEELVWAHFGVQVGHIHHLRLGFYTGDIFTPPPERQRDVEPVLELLRTTDPTVISLAVDPEGSGPDTHYKVLQAIAAAISLWSQEKDLSGLRIWGYRNVWYRFHPSEADVIIPASLNFMAVLDEAFHDCYLSQVDASFPSYEYDGPFSQLAQKIWVEQMKDIQLLLGKNYFYENPLPRLRNAHGLVYMKEMNAMEFIQLARELERNMEGLPLNIIDA